MTPGVLQIVGTNNAPLPIEDVEIAAVQSIVLSGLAAEPWPYLRTGETVRIERGSLSGVEGILVAVKKPYRVVVSVTLLQRSVAVEIDQDWMSPVDQGDTLRSGMAAELVATGA
jgi:transcription antitermination factor NusG